MTQKQLNQPTLIPSYPEIHKVIQFHGGSDSGGVYWQTLNVINIYRTPEGLVIEVE